MRCGAAGGGGRARGSMRTRGGPTPRGRGAERPASRAVGTRGVETWGESKPGVHGTC